MAADSFEDYVRASGPRLKRLAFLLTGDQTEAEDLLQSAYAKVLPHWTRVSSYDAPDAYMRRVMVSLRTSWWRRSRGRERLVDEIPEHASASAGFSDTVVDNQTLLAALRTLPERQRAAVVLRHWCDLSEAETAATMGCSVGTVKSSTSRALAQLRTTLSPALAELADQSPVADRMPAIAGKARQNRDRKLAAGAAALALVAIAAASALHLFSGGDVTGEAPDPVPQPTMTMRPDSLDIDLTVTQLDRTTLKVLYRIHGTSRAWSSAETPATLDVGGPRNTRLLLDGEEAGGYDGGAIECRAGSRPIDFDATWGAPDGLRVTIPGPGTYTLEVLAPSCGVDGQQVPNRVTRTITVR